MLSQEQRKNQNIQHLTSNIEHKMVTAGSYSVIRENIKILTLSP